MKHIDKHKYTLFALLLIVLGLMAAIEGAVSEGAKCTQERAANQSHTSYQSPFQFCD